MSGVVFSKLSGLSRLTSPCFLFQSASKAWGPTSILLFDTQLTWRFFPFASWVLGIKLPVEAGPDLDRREQGQLLQGARSRKWKPWQERLLLQVLATLHFSLMRCCQCSIDSYIVGAACFQQVVFRAECLRRLNAFQLQCMSSHECVGLEGFWSIWGS